MYEAQGDAQSLETTKQEMMALLDTITDPHNLASILRALSSLCHDKSPSTYFDQRLLESSIRWCPFNEFDPDKPAAKMLMDGSITLYESLFQLYYFVRDRPASRLSDMKKDIEIMKREVAYHKQLWTDVILQAEDSLADTETLWQRRMETLEDATD